MSLDVYLKRKVSVTDNHKTSMIKYETLYAGNITHNLNRMAMEAGIYEALWRPYMLKEGYNIPEDDYDAEMAFEENNIIVASEIIDSIEKGLSDLKARPEHFKRFNASNGWGLYENFVPFVKKYLDACKAYPEAIVVVSR